MKKKIFRIIFLSLLSVVTFLLGELILRAIIFSEHCPFPSLKDPGKYAKISSDDYWKLYYKLGGSFHPPEHPHPLLGWNGYFDPATLRHWDLSVPVNKRKVLMFGDSFVMCANDSIECFHEILNADTAFNKENMLLNYGVGGYGIDQECLLLENTVDKFESPFIIFCLTPTDMDRCLLSVRTGQKPYFAEEGDSLKLCGVPVDSLPDNFFEKNPPLVTSYLWRRMVNSKLNPWFSPFMDDQQKEKAKSLSGKIILRAYNAIKKRKLQYVFVLFNELWSEEELWRTDFLKEFLIKNNIDFIDTKDLINKDSTYKEYAYHNYILRNDGHPNSHYNKLLCGKLKNYVLNSAISEKNNFASQEYNRRIEKYKLIIRKDKNWLLSVQEKAAVANIPLDSMLKLDAIYLIECETATKY